MNKQDTLLERIIIDPKIMTGKPIIKGTRLTVQHILKLLAQGITTEEILGEYNRLTKEDIFACLIFANKEKLC
jgi:uncharacterized protein (DUF433 family)